MIFNFDLFGKAESASPSYEDVPYDGSNADDWEAFAPAWAGITPVRLSGETSDHSRQNPVGCTKNTNNMSIYFQGSPVAETFPNGGFATVSKIDLTNYSKMHVQATRASSSGIANLNYCVCGVIKGTKNPPTDGSNTPPGIYTNLHSGETVLDISGVNEAAYLYFGGMTRGAKNTGSNKIVDIVVTRVWLTSDDDSESGDDPSPSDPEATVLYNASNSQQGASNWSEFAPVYYISGNSATRAKVKDANGNVGSVDWHALPVGCAKRTNGLEIYFENPQTGEVINNGAFGSNNTYPIGNYSKLRITATRASSSGPASEGTPWHRCVAGITTSKEPPTDGSGSVTFPPIVLGDLVPGVNEYNISSYSGNYYIYFGGASKKSSDYSGGGVDILVTKIELL